jgi:hypothetical protein
MTILIFIGALVWGSLSGQFLVQIVGAFMGMCQHVAAFFFSRVNKRVNAMGFVTTFSMVIGFGVVFIGGNWIASGFIDYGNWNAASVLSMIAFLGTIVYCSLQVPGKILLTNECAWSPYFFEAANAMPSNQRVAFARKHRKENAGVAKE